MIYGNHCKERPVKGETPSTWLRPPVISSANKMRLCRVSINNRQNKKKGNDQELIQSNPPALPSQKGGGVGGGEKHTHTFINAQARHAQ